MITLNDQVCKDYTSLKTTSWLYHTMPRVTRRRSRSLASSVFKVVRRGEYSDNKGLCLTPLQYSDRWWSLQNLICDLWFVKHRCRYIYDGKLNNRCILMHTIHHTLSYSTVEVWAKIWREFSVSSRFAMNPEPPSGIFSTSYILQWLKYKIQNTLL